MPKKPAGVQLSQQRTRRLPSSDPSQTVYITPSPGFTPPLLLPPPGLCSASLRLKCFRAFLSLFMFIGCRRGVVAAGGGCLATVKAHACDILGILFIQRDCMHKLCFGNYLFKLFKKCMSKHPYQYLVLCIFNLNCKLTLQSLVFEFRVGVKPNISPGLDHLCQHDSEAGPWMNLMS